MPERKGINGTAQLSWANIMLTVAVMLTVAGGTWLMFQKDIASTQQQFKDADVVIRTDIKETREELERIRLEAISRREHTENMKRLDGEISVMREQLRLLESTRPTTGELQSVGAGTRDQINEIKERVRSLEDNLRRPTAPFAQPQSQSRP